MYNNKKFYDLLKEERAKDLYSRLSRQFNFKLINEIAPPQSILNDIVSVLKKYFGKNAETFSKYKGTIKFDNIVEDLKLTGKISKEAAPLLKADKYLTTEYDEFLESVENTYTSPNLSPHEIETKVGELHKNFADEIETRRQQFQNQVNQESSAEWYRTEREAQAARQELQDAAKKAEALADNQRKIVDNFIKKNPGELENLAKEAAKSFPNDRIAALRKLAESLVQAIPELKTVDNALLGLADKGALSKCRIGKIDAVLMAADKLPWYQSAKNIAAAAIVIASISGVSFWAVFDDPKFSWAFRPGAWWNDCDDILNTNPNSPSVGDILPVKLQNCYKWRKESKTLTANQNSNYNALTAAVNRAYGNAPAPAPAPQSAEAPQVKKRYYVTDKGEWEIIEYGEDEIKVRGKSGSVGIIKNWKKTGRMVEK